MDCLLWFWNELLPQVEEVKYLVVLFTSEGRMEQDIAYTAPIHLSVMWVMYKYVMVKKDCEAFDFLVYICS